MKIGPPPTPAPLCALAFALSLAGCFGGEDGDAGTSLGPKGDGRGKISPGLYVGDYAAYDSGVVLESEFSLGADGAFRLVWIADNEPFGDLQGDWFQQDSNLHFTGMTETYIDWGAGLFPPGDSKEDDTNSVREVTDSSFIRKEWTPLRQKPYWIAYRKKEFRPLKPGSYRFDRDLQVDSATHLTLGTRIELDGGNILFRYSEDTLETEQHRAVWFQHGSILGAANFEAREYDTAAKAFGDWQPYAGVQMERVSEVSDTAFRKWSPPDFFRDGTWDVYRRVP